VAKRTYGLHSTPWSTGRLATRKPITSVVHQRKAGKIFCFRLSPRSRGAGELGRKRLPRVTVTEKCYKCFTAPQPRTGHSCRRVRVKHFLYTNVSVSVSPVTRRCYKCFTCFTAWVPPIAEDQRYGASWHANACPNGLGLVPLSWRVQSPLPCTGQTFCRHAFLSSCFPLLVVLTFVM